MSLLSIDRLLNFLFLQHQFEIFGKRLKIFLVRDFVLENLQYNVVGNGIFPLSGVEQALVETNSASLTLDILLEYRFHKRIVGRIVAAACYLVPLLRLRDGCAA
jgi:hypothetical protein